jgi:hypothetical protein
MNRSFNVDIQSTLVGSQDIRFLPDLQPAIDCRSKSSADTLGYYNQVIATTAYEGANTATNQANIPLNSLASLLCG